MRFCEWEVSVYESQLLTHVAPNTLYDRVSATTVRTLEVAVLDECHGSVAGTEDMIALIDGNCEPR